MTGRFAATRASAGISWSAAMRKSATLYHTCRSGNRRVVAVAALAFLLPVVDAAKGFASVNGIFSIDGIKLRVHNFRCELQGIRATAMKGIGIRSRHAFAPEVFAERKTDDGREVSERRAARTIIHTRAFQPALAIQGWTRGISSGKDSGGFQ